MKKPYSSKKRKTTITSAKKTSQKVNKSVEKKDNHRSKKEVKVREIVVNYPMKLMDFIIKNYPSYSRNNVKSLLQRKQVLVNDIPISQFDYELILKDVVKISPYSNKSIVGKKFPLKVIYEDEEFIVINKPHGLLSISTDKEKEITAYRLVSDYVRNKNPKERIFVVHRLDKETSGILVFVKNASLKEAMQDDWNSLVKTREYYAICEGGPFEKKCGKHVSYLLETKTNLMYSSHDAKGQKAITNYEVVAEKDIYSLVKVNLESGRKNQIRVHMKDLHHQVVGDEKYSSSTNPISRLGLHCRVLEFDHPTNKTKHFKFISPVPKEFLNLFEITKIK